MRERAKKSEVETCSGKEHTNESADLLVHHLLILVDAVPGQCGVLLRVAGGKCTQLGQHDAHEVRVVWQRLDDLRAQNASTLLRLPAERRVPGITVQETCMEPTAGPRTRISAYFASQWLALKLVFVFCFIQDLTVLRQYGWARVSTQYNT